MTIYRIKDWNEHFENNKSREREKCSFCCVPNKQDGLGYGSLMALENGEALYGAFVAVVLVASKQKSRSGWLTDNGLHTGCPLTARQLSIKCRFSETTIQKMLDAVSANEIGWIERIDKNASEVPANCPSDALEGKEGKGKKEGKEVPPVLKMSERISLEKELERVTREICGMGMLSDYDSGSQKWARLVHLLKRQKEIYKTLGVVA
ncbi:MAG: hypothetical protein WCH99_04110 [Verrucomicrobiota bacterium]